MEIVDICRALASNFASLAEELEKQQKKNEARMSNIEYEVEQNCDVLKDVANAIIARFN